MRVISMDTFRWAGRGWPLPFSKNAKLLTQALLLKWKDIQGQALLTQS